MALVNDLQPSHAACVARLKELGSYLYLDPVDDHWDEDKAPKPSWRLNGHYPLIVMHCTPGVFGHHSATLTYENDVAKCTRAAEQARQAAEDAGDDF